MRIALACIAVAIAGCATQQPKVRYVWRHEAKGQQEFYGDRAQCSAMAGPGSSGLAYTPPVAMSAAPNTMYNAYAYSAMAQRRDADARSDQIFSDCMMGQGWRQVPAAGAPDRLSRNASCPKITGANGVVRQACD